MGEFSSSVAAHPRTNEIEVTPRGNNLDFNGLYHILCKWSLLLTFKKLGSVTSNDLLSLFC